MKGSLNEEDKNYTHLIIEQGVSITGPNPLVIDSFDDNSHHCYGAVVDIYGKIENNLLGVKSPAAISIDARLKDINNAPVVNIHDDAVIGNKHDGGVGIYLFGFANINAEKATIEAHTGIFAATGSINLEGTTITGNGKEDYKEKYGRGTGTTGAAIQIESNSNYTGNVKVNIDGGRYTSEHNAAVVEYTNGATETSVKEIKISGGEFKSAEEYNAIDTSESFKENNKGFITGGTFVGNEDIDSSYLASGYELGADGSVEVIPSSSSSSSKPETSEPTKEETMITEGVTFEDTNDGLVIEGNIIENKTDTYEKMIEYAGEKGYGNLFKMYEFHVKGNGSLNRNITITFDLGEENNGKKAYILHQKHDNSYEEWERKVEDGKVSITVSELSPFTVMLESTVDNEITNNPQTGDNLYKYLVLLCVGSLGMIIGLKPLTRKFAK